MPIVFETRFDGSDAVRYFQVSLVGFYLDSSRQHALRCLSETEENNQLRESISAVSFASMTIEALINESAEDLVPEVERRPFDKGYSPFNRPKGQTLVAFKYVMLVEKYKNEEVPEDIKDSIAWLIELRNKLVHYKPTDTAGKIILPPPVETITPHGVMKTIDFMAEPKRIEPPLVAELNTESAVRAYNTARSTALHWTSINGGAWDSDDFPVLSI